MNPLQLRLAALRCRLRLVITARGLCWLVSLLLLAAILAGFADWRFHLPDSVRAVVLITTLIGSCIILFRILVLPLLAPADDLALALRIEGRFPFLKDSLGSTVQFLEQPEDPGGAQSLELRREAIQQTMRKVQYLEFHRVVDTRGMPAAGLAMAAAGLTVITLALFCPLEAATALERLANPFGGADWPKQTRLEIQAPTRLARGERFEIRGYVFGVRPAQAVVDYEGGASPPETCQILPGKDGAPGSFVARRERVEQSFRFQVQANDAISGWHEVTVQPPPVLVPLDGRPSPQIHLDFPAYTDLTPLDLPDGVGNIEAVAGTMVTLRAATDRPLTRAWIEYRPERSLVTRVIAGAIGNPRGVEGAVAAAGGRFLWDRVPIPLKPGGQVLTVRFWPGISGTYALHFQDESGLANVRLFDLRIFPDPSPSVFLERPSSAQDSLDVLPGASIALHGVVEDPQFAVRSVFLEYRCGKADSPRRLGLYDHQAFGRALPALLTALSGQSMVNPPLRLRPQQLMVARILSLEQFHHADGSPLKEGDVLTLQLCADDFDDVAIEKQPGRSHEVETRIVDRSSLEMILTNRQHQVQQELLKLRKRQQEAAEQVIGPEQQWRNTGRLREEDVAQLFRAEQLQQAVRAGVGTDKEGLRAEVARLLRTMRDNQMPRSDAQEQMETVAAELDRMARSVLPQIEPRLTRARKEKQASFQGQQRSAGSQDSLGEVRELQKEAENTFTELLKLLETWSGLSQVKGEARDITQEQRKLQDETKALDRDDTRGKPREDLTADQKAVLGKVGEAQNKLGDRAADLLGQMERMGREQNERDGAMSSALKAAAERGQKEDVAGQMQNAGQMARENRLGAAMEAQQKAMQAMEGLLQKLEQDQREKELDRLRKKLQEAEEKMADLAGRQERLRKKSREAEAMADPAQRDAELRRLAREQADLHKEVQDTLRELSRLRAEKARQALQDAGESMAQAGQQLSRNEQPDDSQEEALDRINEARRELKQEQKQVEEELAREKLRKIADQIKALRERQNTAIAEADRLQREASQQKAWDRNRLISLGHLADNQKDLGEETDALAKEKLTEAKVFARMLTKAASAMREAADQLRNYRERAKDNPEEVVAATESTKLQREGLRRLDQLLDALKPEKGVVSAPPPEAGGSAENRGGRQTEASLGMLAQLKGLRMFQYEVNQQTEAFARRHLDLTKLAADAQRELEELQKEQQEVAEMLDELTKPTSPEGDTK
jgi:hypothetical protein